MSIRTYTPLRVNLTKKYNGVNFTHNQNNGVNFTLYFLLHNEFNRSRSKNIE
jgi:hypothetical protein